MNNNSRTSAGGLMNGKRKQAEYDNRPLDGQRVLAHGILRGYATHYELAEALGMSPAAFSYAMRGVRQPLGFADRVAEALGTTVDELAPRYYVIPAHIAEAIQRAKADAEANPTAGKAVPLLTGSRSDPRPAPATEYVMIPRTIGMRQKPPCIRPAAKMPANYIPPAKSK